MRLIKALPAIGLLLALASPAGGQSGCGGQFPANQFCGTGGSQGLPGPRLIPAGGTTPIGGGTVLGNPSAVSALPTATVAPVLGIPGTSVGSISFANITTGTVKLQPVTGALGSNVLTIPAITDTIAGVALANGGTNNALVASNGGIVYSDASKLNILAATATARQMLQSGANTAPAWSTATYPATTAAGSLLTSASANTITGSVTPVLGVPTVSQGTLGFAGVSSGTATVTAQAAAGSPTITLPNTTGTLADGASLPIVLSATTGNLTCPTCVTSSGGGAITGTAPIAVSAAGAVSITGAAGQVLAGASPAFTATPVLGASGTVGTIGFGNATSGIVTLGTVTGALGTVTASLPANTGTIAELNFAQTWSANQSFNSGNLILNGSGSGSSVLNAPATGGGTATLFAGSDTITGIAIAQTLTNKTITSSTDVLGGVTMTLGSDATGDIYYRNVSGILTRLAIGSSTNVLTVSGGLPAWTAASSGGTVTSVASGVGISNGTASPITTTGTLYAIGIPQGRLTLVSATPVMTSNQTAKGTIFYDSYNGGNVVSYYNGTNDVTEAIAGGEVSDAMVAAASAGQTTAGNVFDVWWVHGGANRICLAMSASTGGGGGWQFDTGGSNTARGTGYSQLDFTTRQYITNKNSITNCFNGSTNYGPVTANQGTYLGSIYTTAAGQTGMNFKPAAAAGGGANILGVYNAYNRVPVSGLSRDSTSTWTYAVGSWRAANNNANNSISWVDGLAQSFVDCAYSVPTAQVTSLDNVAIGCNLNSTSATPNVASANQAASASNIITLQSNEDFFPQFGFNTLNAVEFGNTNSITFYGTGLFSSLQNQHLLVRIGGM